MLRQSVDTQLIAVEAVLDEVHLPPAFAAVRHALDIGLIHRHRLSTADELAWLAGLRSHGPRLGAGEVESLAACFANGWDFASDDRDARRMASSVETDHRIVVTGTIGMHVRAVRREIVDPATAELLFQEMVARGFRAPVSRLLDLLQDQ